MTKKKPKKPGKALVAVDPTEGGKYCGARTRPGAKHPHCHQRSGFRTDHPGQGRCSKHGGKTPITSGRGSRNLRYAGITRPRIRDLYKQFEDDPDPLNIFPELASARAVMVDFLERYDEWREALLAWHASYQELDGPIPYDLESAFLACLEEYEIVLREGGEPTKKQQEDLKLALGFVEHLKNRQGVAAAKPRQVLDPSAAMAHLTAITAIAQKEWERHEKNAISRKDLIRLMNQLGMSVERLVRQLIVDDVKATKSLRDLRMEWRTLALNL